MTTARNLPQKTYYKSPLGWMEIVGDEQGVSRVEFVGGSSARRAAAPLRRCARELEEYFQGKRTTFTVPLHPEGTRFQTRVWKKLRNVRFARSVSYRELAGAVGNAAAARAVGGALNKNKIAVVVPCHRVLGRDGSLTGYASGVWRKARLLDHERSVLVRKGRV